MDFVFDSSPTDLDALHRALHSVYPASVNGRSHSFSGPWGVLAVLDPQTGGSVYENPTHIGVVAGEPIVSVGSGGNTAQRLLTAWSDGILDWATHLNGAFAALILDKATGDVHLVTDLLAFIPLTIFQDGHKQAVSTHVDVLAHVNPPVEFDAASLADFTLHGAVTYPYTAYAKIRQLPPGSVTILPGYSPRRVESSSYWEPLEDFTFATLGDAAEALSATVSSYVEDEQEHRPHAAQFLSGGEDSRILAGMLSRGGSADAFTFVDGPNRESTIASRVARRYEVRHTVAYRDPLHYILHVDAAARQIGSLAQFFHAHALGMPVQGQLAQYDGVFGGWFADSLLKARHAPTRHPPLGVPLVPARLLATSDRARVEGHGLFSDELLQIVRLRRFDHLRRVQSLRPISGHEWFELWPSSMRGSAGNLHSNRRLFRSVEPFTAHDVVRISAATPTEWKFGRSLYRAAFQKYLKPSMWVPHTEGHYPYFSDRANRVMAFPGWSTVTAAKTLQRLGLRTEPHAAWSNWTAVMRSAHWYALLESSTDGYNALPLSTEAPSIVEVVSDTRLNVEQRLNLLQMSRLLGQSH